MVTNEDGHSQEHDVYMNATSYIVRNLKAPSTYMINMFTKYGTDEYFVMSEPVNATINLVLSNRGKYTIYIYVRVKCTVQENMKLN